MYKQQPIISLRKHAVPKKCAVKASPLPLHPLHLHQPPAARMVLSSHPMTKGAHVPIPPLTPALHPTALLPLPRIPVMMKTLLASLTRKVATTTTTTMDRAPSEPSHLLMAQTLHPALTTAKLLLRAAVSTLLLASRPHQLPHLLPVMAPWLPHRHQSQLSQLQVVLTPSRPSRGQAHKSSQA